MTYPSFLNGNQTVGNILQKGQQDMPDEFDWETGLYSGIGTAVDEWFAVSEGGGNTNLYIKVTGPAGEEGECRWSLGPDWASYDGGETVEHPKGDQRNYNVNTAAAELFRSAFACGAEEVLRKRSAELYDGKGPRHAKLWHGLRFRWEVKTEHMKFKDRQTGEMIERDVSRVLPVEYLGESDPDVPAATTTEAPAGVPPEQSGDPLAFLAAEDSAKVKVLAKTTPYSEWVDKVMELPGVVSSPTLMAALGDEALYNTLKER